jgi:hypothetical protein
MASPLIVRRWKSEAQTRSLIIEVPVKFKGWKGQRPVVRRDVRVSVGVLRERQGRASEESTFSPMKGIYISFHQMIIDKYCVDKGAATNAVIFRLHQIKNLHFYLRGANNERFRADNTRTEPFKVERLEDVEIKALSVDADEMGCPVEMFRHDRIDIDEWYFDDLLDGPEALGLCGVVIDLILGKGIKQITIRTADHVIICDHLTRWPNSNIECFVLGSLSLQSTAKCWIRLNENSSTPFLIEQVCVIEEDWVGCSDIEIGRVFDSKRIADRLDDEVFPLLRV